MAGLQWHNQKGMPDDALLDAACRIHLACSVAMTDKV